jgi:hypothetical protein
MIGNSSNGLQSGSIWLWQQQQYRLQDMTAIFLVSVAVYLEGASLSCTRRSLFLIGI